MEAGNSYADARTSPTASVTPVIPWQTPWSQHPPSQQTDEPAPSSRHYKQHERPARKDSLRELEHFHGQQRLHQHRQTSLELLEARSINRALEEQHRQDREVIQGFRGEIEILRKELREARASLENARREERRLSAALKGQAALLASEAKGRGNAAAAAAAAAEAEADQDGGLPRNTRRTTDSSSRAASVWADSSSSGGGSTDGSTDLDSSSSRRCGTEPTKRASSSSSSAAAAAAYSPKPSLSPLAAAAAAAVAVAPAGGEGDGPELPDLLECARRSLTGTVSIWLRGMQAACSEGLRQALVLPWLLHKLFYLSTELIDERREELLNIFVGGGGRAAAAAAAAVGAGGGVAREEESAYMLRHLRRHYLTVFPLSGDNLRTAVHDVMMALAHSMIDSDEWNPSAKDPVAVQSALAASGLEKIVEEYLTIAVLCCLQHPVATFTDDLGEVERYSPERHSEPIDGEPPGEWCIVIFPAFVQAAGVPGEERPLGKRFVLNHQNLDA